MAGAADRASAWAGAAGGVGQKRAWPAREWWRGFFTGMTDRKLISLSSHCFVLCYAREEDGGCRAASVDPAADAPAAVSKAIAATNDTAGAVAADDAAAIAGAVIDTLTGLGAGATAGAEGGEGRIGHNPRLLPPLLWGTAQPYWRGRVERLEAERLSPGRFAVCFQRSTGATSAVACTAGALEDSVKAAAAPSELGPFAPVLDIGPGRLISITVARAGLRFAVCLHARAGGEAEASAQVSITARRGPISCHWAEVAGSLGGRLELRLAEGEGLEVAI